MQKSDHGMIDIGDASLYYETAGAGRPLLLAHAGIVDSRMWDAQWTAFAERYRVIRYDMRGCGRSPAPRGPFSQHLDMLRLLQALDIERAALLGISKGGEVAIDFALEHPEMAGALIPVSAVPGGFEMQGEPPADLMAMMEAMQQGDSERVSDLQVRIFVDGPARGAGEADTAVRRQVAEMTRVPIANGVWWLQDAQPLEPPAAGRLGDIHTPTLIVSGALDNAELLRAASVMEKEIHGAQRINIPNAAHLPNMEQPDLFNQAVLDFLTRAGW